MVACAQQFSWSISQACSSPVVYGQMAKDAHDKCHNGQWSAVSAAGAFRAERRLIVTVHCTHYSHVY